MTDQPARFYLMPVKHSDGTVTWEHSSVQMTVGPDGEPRPLEVKTPQQLADWNAIQDARPLTATEHETKVNAAAARPLFRADAEADASDGSNLLDGARFAAEAEAGVIVVSEDSPPRTRVEHDERAAVAAQLAARLGYVLTWVRDDLVTKVPAHLELRNSLGTPFMAGDLVTLETALRGMARERAQRDARIAQWEAHRAQLAAEQAERIANLPENRLARLEAKLAEAGIQV